VGLVAGGTLGGATAYCRIAGIAYLVLAVVGLLTPTGFGLIPIGGHDVWLHAGIGGILTAVGFRSRAVWPRPGTDRQAGRSRLPGRSVRARQAGSRA
jgi:hypothetical protein